MPSELEDKWEDVLESKQELASRAFARALESSQSIGYGFIVVKKDRRSNYHIQHKTWDEVIEDIRKLGGVGPSHRDMANAKTEV